MWPRTKITMLEGNSPPVFAKKNARDFVALPEQVFRSADLKLASSEAPPPVPPISMLCVGRRGVFCLAK